jgi:hypothetical protein
MGKRKRASSGWSTPPPATVVIALARAVAEATCRTYQHRANVESDPVGIDLALRDVNATRLATSDPGVIPVGGVSILTSTFVARSAR